MTDLSSEKWERVKELITAMSPYPKGMYQPIEHPFFKDWGLTEVCNDRLQTILDYVKRVDGKKILDIGCCYGYFSHKLAQIGAEVTGVDICEQKIEVCKLLSGCYGLSSSNPRFYCSSYQEYFRNNRYFDNKYFDIILFLSGFHHELRADVNAAWNDLAVVSLHTDLMLIDLCEGTAKAHVKDWRPELMVEHTEFTEVVPVKLSRRPRMLYALRKLLGDENGCSF